MPPYWHGELSHSLMSVSQFLPGRQQNYVKQVKIWRLKSSGMWRCVAGWEVPNILRDCSASGTIEATDSLTLSHSKRFDASTPQLWDHHTNYAECNNGEFAPFCLVISKTTLTQKSALCIQYLPFFFQLLFKTSFMSKIFITPYLRDTRHMSNNFGQFTSTKFQGDKPNSPQTVSCIHKGTQDGFNKQYVGIWTHK